MPRLEAGFLIGRVELADIFKEENLRQVPEGLKDTWQHFQEEFNEVENNLLEFCKECLEDIELAKFKDEVIVSRLYQSIAMLKALEEVPPVEFYIKWADRLLKLLRQSMPEGACAEYLALIDHYRSGEDKEVCLKKANELVDKAQLDAKLRTLVRDHYYIWDCLSELKNGTLIDLEDIRFMLGASIRFYGDEAIDFMAEIGASLKVQPAVPHKQTGKDACHRLVDKVRRALRRAEAVTPVAHITGAMGGAGGPRNMGNLEAEP